MTAAVLAATHTHATFSLPCVQSAMGDDGSSSPYKNSFTLTAAKLNLSNPLDAKLEGVYLYVGEWVACDVQAARCGTATCHPAVDSLPTRLPFRKYSTVQYSGRCCLLACCRNLNCPLC